jgi:hypothetical protein
MKTVRLLGSFLAGATRAIGEGFVAFFRFTEEDANILLSAHGFHAAERERLEKSVSDEKGKNLRLSEEFAEEARHACARLSVDPPEIRREWWRDLIKIGKSGENLVRPVRLVTSELVAALAGSSSPDDIERLFQRPSPHFRIIRMTATIAAASAVAMAVFMAGRMFPDGRRNAVARLAAVSPAPTLLLQIAATTPAISQAVPIALPIIAAPTPVLSAPPHILVKRPETEPLIKTRHIPLIAKESKIEAVERASAPWDGREKTIDRQLNNIDKRITTSSEGRKRTLVERQSLLERKRDYVRRSRKYYKGEARLAWDKAHGAPTLWDHLLANIGF